MRGIVQEHDSDVKGQGSQVILIRPGIKVGGVGNAQPHGVVGCDGVEQGVEEGGGIQGIALGDGV